MVVGSKFEPAYRWIPGQTNRYQFTNVWTTIAGSATEPGNDDGTNTDARFNQPFGLAMDPAGNLFVADTLNHTIRRMSPVESQWITTTVAGTPGLSGSADGTNNTARFNQPTGIAADALGNLFVSDSLNNTIRKIRIIGTRAIVTTIAGLPGIKGFRDGTNHVAAFNRPMGIAVDHHGIIYVADSLNHTIREIRPRGSNWVVKTIAGSPLSPGKADGMWLGARFNQPAGITLDPAGNLYVADQLNSTIRKMHLSGTNWIVSTIAGFPGMRGWNDGLFPSSRFSTPSAISADTQTNLYVTDSSNNNIRKMTPIGTNWLVSTLAGWSGSRGTNSGLATDTQFSYPSAIAVNTDGSLYYVADSLNDTIRAGGRTVNMTNILLGTWQQMPVVKSGKGFLIRSGTSPFAH